MYCTEASLFVTELYVQIFHQCECFLAIVLLCVLFKASVFFFLFFLFWSFGCFLCIAGTLICSLIFLLFSLRRSHKARILGVTHSSLVDLCLPSVSLALSEGITDSVNIGVFCVDWMMQVSPNPSLEVFGYIRIFKFSPTWTSDLCDPLSWSTLRESERSPSLSHNRFRCQPQ